MLSKLFDSVYDTPQQTKRRIEQSAPKKNKRSCDYEISEKGRYFVFISLLLLMWCLLFKGYKLLSIVVCIFNVLFFILTQEEQNYVENKMF